MSCPIVPAIIPASESELLESLKKVSFAREIQIDVVDGKFVDYVSWPYDPKGSPNAVKHHTDVFTLEVDLMVKEPILAARDWVAAGADMLVFHMESVSLDAFKQFVAHADVTVGVSMTAGSNIEEFLLYAGVADYVQLMGIASIGAQGQPFDASVLDVIQKVKEAFPEKMISIDGSVNVETITRLRDAGANRFVSGSAVLAHNDPQVAYNELCSVVNG